MDVLPPSDGCLSSIFHTEPSLVSQYSRSEFETLFLVNSVLLGPLGCELEEGEGP